MWEVYIEYSNKHFKSFTCSIRCKSHTNLLPHHYISRILFILWISRWTVGFERTFKFSIKFWLCMVWNFFASVGKYQWRRSGMGWVHKAAFKYRLALVSSSKIFWVSVLMLSSMTKPFNQTVVYFTCWYISNGSKIDGCSF